MTLIAASWLTYSGAGGLLSIGEPLLLDIYIGLVPSGTRGVDSTGWEPAKGEGLSVSLLVRYMEFSAPSNGCVLSSSPFSSFKFVFFKVGRLAKTMNRNSANV